MQMSSLFTPAEQRGAPCAHRPVSWIRTAIAAGAAMTELATAYADDVQARHRGFRRRRGAVSRAFYSARRSRARGCRRCPRAFMAKVLAHVHTAGGFFIADEVQAGFGRFGSHMWGHQSSASFPTSSRSASRWAMATRWRASSREPELIDEFHRAATCTSIPSAATPYPPRSGPPCSMSRGRTSARTMQRASGATLSSGSPSSRSGTRSSATCAAGDVLCGRARERPRHEVAGDRGHQAGRERDVRARCAHQPHRMPRQHPEDPAADAVLAGNMPICWSIHWAPCSPLTTIHDPAAFLAEMRARAERARPLGSRREECRPSKCARTPCSGSTSRAAAARCSGCIATATIRTRHCIRNLPGCGVLEAAGISVPRDDLLRQGRLRGGGNARGRLTAD